MGHVLFTAKAEPAKAEPAIDWSEIESRLQEISAGAKPAGDEPLDLAPEASATLATTRRSPNDPHQPGDPPTGPVNSVSGGNDSLDTLSLLVAIPSNRS